VSNSGKKWESRVFPAPNREKLEIIDMLRGASQINLDAKGRLAVPTRYRAQLQETCKGQLVTYLISINTPDAFSV